MKKTIRLTESNLHRIVKESVRRVLNEGYNQFSDDDFASSGNPYGLCDDFECEKTENNLDGSYVSFNNIWVEIRNDGENNAYIAVGSKRDNRKREFEGENAQRILDKIRRDISNYQDLHTALYKNLYNYVL